MKVNIEGGVYVEIVILHEVFNILGESVSKAVDESLDAGFYNFKIDMKGLASGMYFYRLTATSENGQQLYNDMKKMILLQ